MENHTDPSGTLSVQLLTTLLQVQAQAIVSRVLLKNAGGTVTLFAFDQGEGLSDHATPFDALVLGVEGSGELEIAGATARLEPGAMVTIPAQARHAVRALSPFKMLLIMVRA